MSRPQIVVFCASTPSGEKKEYYLNMARDFGRMLAENGYACANGGSQGMMRALCEGAFTAGGEVFCVNLEEWPPDHEFYTDLQLRAALIDRQMLLINERHGYVALPGGAGTLYEITHVLAHMALGEIDASKPLICVGEEWGLLKQLLESQLTGGLMFSNPFEHITFVPTIQDAIAVLNARLRS